MNSPLWRLASRNLLRNRRRTVATGLATIFGYVGLVLLSAYIFRTYMGLRTSSVYLNQKGHIAILKKDSLSGFAAKPKKYLLYEKERKAILAALDHSRDDVEIIGQFLNGTGILTQGSRSAPVMISGLEPELYPKLVNHAEMKKWAPDWVRDFPGAGLEQMAAHPDMVSITSLLGEAIGRTTPLAQWSESEREVQIIAKSYEADMGAVDARLGIEHTTGLKLAEETSLIAPLQLLQNLYATDGIEYIAVFLHDATRSFSLARQLRTELGDGYDVFTFDDANWSPVFVGAMNFLYVIGGFFIYLILGAVALALVNTTTLNLLERTREIGTLRAMGFPPVELRNLFRHEAFILCTLSIALGTGIALLIEWVVNSLNIRFSPPGTQGDVQFMLKINPLLCFVMALLILGITMISTEFIVRRKTREKIITLLSDQGA